MSHCPPCSAHIGHAVTCSIDECEPNVDTVPCPPSADLPISNALPIEVEAARLAFQVARNELTALEFLLAIRRHRNDPRIPLSKEHRDRFDDSIHGGLSFDLRPGSPCLNELAGAIIRFLDKPIPYVRRSVYMDDEEYDCGATLPSWRLEADDIDGT